jgi:hypothetical protein
MSAAVVRIIVCERGVATKSSGTNVTLIVQFDLLVEVGPGRLYFNIRNELSFVSTLSCPRNLIWARCF